MIINSQLGGKTPTGTKSITANGVYDVTDFASADVQVPTTAPAHYIQRNVDANGKLVTTGSMPFIDLNGVTDIGDYALYYAYYKSNISGSVTLSLTNISGAYACSHIFAENTNITSVDLSSLTTATGVACLENAFDRCTQLGRRIAVA